MIHFESKNGQRLIKSIRDSFATIDGYITRDIKNTCLKEYRERVLVTEVSKWIEA